MPAYFGYSNAILGTQTTAGVGGGPIDYRVANSGSWSYSGASQYFVVEEARTNNTNFDGDPTNEQIDSQLQIGGSRAQTIVIDGIERQAIWDYTFEVSLGSDTWRVGVIDVDLNNSDTIEAGSENGYYLVFPDGFPPPDTDLTFGPVIENDSRTSHLGLGGEVVCFAQGTQILTAKGETSVEDLAIGDLILTRDAGLMPLRWIGQSTVTATDKLAPIAIAPGVLQNASELIVSPQHALLLNDWRAEFYFGANEVLVRAIDLLGLDGVQRKPGGMVTYWHILLDSHELVQAAGTWAETLYLGDVTQRTLSPDARAEIETLFPDLLECGAKAARCLRRFEARCLAA